MWLNLNAKLEPVEKFKRDLKVVSYLALTVVLTLYGFKVKF